MKRLAITQPKEVRIAAAKYLWKEVEKPQTVRAIPALLRSLHDRDAELREMALRALATITLVHNKPCPLELVEGLLDLDAEVRMTAQTYLHFKQYPADARPLMLCASRSQDAHVRSVVLVPLADHWGKDPMVRKVLKKACKDEVLQVRHNAHVALWRATHRLKSVVPYWLSSLDLESKSSTRLYANGSALLLRDAAQKHPVRLAKLLIKLLKNKSATIRRSSARVLGALAVEKKTFKTVLKKLDVERKLKSLLKDENDKVREAAKNALSHKSTLLNLYSESTRNQQD